MADIYRDPVINKLIARFEAGGPKMMVGRYYHGDPIVVPQGSLPACFISKDSTQVRPADTADDDHRMAYVINAVFNLRNYANQSLDQIDAYNQLSEVMEGRDTSYKLKTDTLAYQLRHQDQLDANLWIDIDTATEIDYGIGIEKRGSGIYTIEAVLRTTIRNHQLR